MPAIVRPVGDERDALLTFLEHERHVLLIAAHGLTDEQARSTPTVSDLSIRFLLEHMTSTEGTWASMIVGSTRSSEDTSGDTTRPPETLGDVVAAYRDAIATTDAALAAVADLDQVVALPEGTRWAPPGTEWSVRWVLLHLIHETARHAGHADIIRESIDGATALPLMAAVEGWPPRRTITPWTPSG